MGEKLIYVAAIILLVPFTCIGDDPPMRTEGAISEIQRQIAIGMPRVEVEEKVAKIPHVYSVYTPQEHILPLNERVFAGTALSGRLTVSTPLEISGLEKASGHIVIEFDEQDRVVNLRVGGFGFKKEP